MDVRNPTSAGAPALTRTAVKTGAYAAAAGDLVPVDTTSGAVTVTLPTAPATGTRVAVKHIVQGSTNAVTIAAGGSDVFNKTGGLTSVSLALVNQSVQVQYDAGIWSVVAGDLPLSGLDARYATAATLALKADARAAYLGPVANRGRLAGANISSAIYKQMMTWRRYRAAEDIPAVALLYCSAQGTTEDGVTATGTITASVEYPMGTYTRITSAAGSATGTVLPTAALQTDLTPLPTIIPKGAVFWIGTYSAWGAGTTPRYQDRIGAFGSAFSAAARESVAASATSVTDTTLTGVRTEAGANTWDTFGPAAVLGMTRRPTAFLAGDSETQGQLIYSAVDDADGLQGITERLVGLRCGYINAGVGSDNYTLANATYTQRLALSQFCTHIIDSYGVNDAYANNAAAELAAFTTFRNKFAASKPFYKTTVIPKVSGRWSLADLSDQTPASTLANFVAWNTLIRSGLNGLVDGIIDMEAVTSPQIGTGKITPAQRVVSDAAITSGANVLTSASAAFTAADVGKLVGVAGAGAAGAYLVAAIGAVTNSTTVTLVNQIGSALNAGTTVSGAVAGIGLSSLDGTHQTILREQAIRGSAALAGQVDMLVRG